MRDRTAMTEPLTIGQRIVAKWEGPASDWSKPADLADAIDAAIIAEREACARIAEAVSRDNGQPNLGAKIARGVRRTIQP